MMIEVTFPVVVQTEIKLATVKFVVRSDDILIYVLQK